MRTRQLALMLPAGGSPHAARRKPHAARMSGSLPTLYSRAYAPPACPHPAVAPVSREASDASAPPMLKHWREVKSQHPSTILFYRVGDFYE
jgi:hypothetical protein